MPAGKKSSGSPRKTTKSTSRASTKKLPANITPEELRDMAMQMGYDIMMRDSAKGVDIAFTANGARITPKDHDRWHDKGGNGGSYDKDVSH